ncbi:MAG: hypothetical protein JXR59_03665 [Desulfuromonadaceae bacterium]|nr:hypothetical protein [Desulfuromonadaceae bacterium]
MVLKRCNPGWAVRLVFMVLFVLISGGLSQAAVETLLAVGYADNAQETRDGTGSPFSVYQLEGRLELVPVSPWGVEVYGRSDYRDYWRLADNYSLEAGGRLERTVWEGRLAVAMLTSILWYRDDLQPDDARNDYQLASELTLYLDERWSAGLSLTYVWADYRGRVEESTADASGPGESGQGGGRSPSQGEAVDMFSRSREDRLWTLGGRLECHLSADWQTSVVVRLADCDSTIRRESCDELAVENNWVWQLAWHWRAEAWWHLVWRRYHQDSERNRKVGALLAWQWLDNSEIALSWQLLEADADRDDDNYRAMVSLCALKWFF